MSKNLSFRRPQLAKAYCDSLEGKGITSARSGLFLAGPRRVGKSTFLKEDLIPEALNRNWLPVYVDLWEDKSADPLLLLSKAIQFSVGSLKGKWSAWADKIHLQKVNLLGSVELDFPEGKLSESLTLLDLFSRLIQIAKRPLLVIIDEAQHAMSTKEGLNMMFSIKSVRDQLNMSHGTPQLMLVFTGSNRDKLSQLVVKKDQPFFGSEVTGFPLLGREYTDFFTEQINKALSQDNQFSPESVWEAFQLTGHRPEILSQMVGKVALQGEGEAFSDLLKKNAFVWHARIWEVFEDDYQALPPLQRAVLFALVEEGRGWAPFSDSSMESYRKFMNKSDISHSSIQAAIQSLREKGFLWQSGRGQYALEDDAFLEWFRHTYLQK
jgi:hypothetical protein